MIKIQQTIVVRKDLKNSDSNLVSPGKIAAQVAHASWGSVLKHFIPYNISILSFCLALIVNPIILIWYCILRHPLVYWFRHDFTKVILVCKNEKQLFDIEQQCKDNNLKHCLIRDNGLTEFNNIITPTCIGIGPDYKHNIDKVTRKLQVMK